MSLEQLGHHAEHLHCRVHLILGHAVQPRLNIYNIYLCKKYLNLLEKPRKLYFFKKYKVKYLVGEGTLAHGNSVATAHVRLQVVILKLK